MASTSRGYHGLVDDDGISTFTVKVHGTYVSGGDWVSAGSNTAAATLSLSGGEPVFNTDMVCVDLGGSGTTRPLGMALNNAASGSSVAILTRGKVICPANGTITEGGNVAASYVTAGEGCVADAAAGSPSFNASDVIGIGLTAQTSGTNNFTLVELNIG